jgi:type I site-specific restriction endonuclease
MYLNEPDTRAKLIDPAIHRHGWSEDLIRQEVAEALATLRGVAVIKP